MASSKRSAMAPGSGSSRSRRSERRMCRSRSRSDSSSPSRARNRPTGPMQVGSFLPARIQRLRVARLFASACADRVRCQTRSAYGSSRAGSSSARATSSGHRLRFASRVQRPPALVSARSKWSSSSPTFMSAIRQTTRRPSCRTRRRSSSSQALSASMTGLTPPRTKILAAAQLAIWASLPSFQQPSLRSSFSVLSGSCSPRS